MYFTLRIIENLLVLYFTGYLLLDIFLFIYAVVVFRRQLRHELPVAAYEGHSVSIIVPGYNEAVTIVPCLKQLLQLDYPAYNVIFVNDGSTDNTFDKIKMAFTLQPVVADAQGHDHPCIDTARVRGVYRSSDGRLLVVDKENGGKADSVNAGINLADARYICTVDADSILDRTALRAVVSPLIHDPRVFVSGGQLAAANDVHLLENRVHGAHLPRNIWVLWQITEYIKSFMISKIGLSRFNALLIMSGAFSVYRRADLQAVDGFLTRRNRGAFLARTIGLGHHTVCEDMEIVVRLWRYYRESGRPGKTAFMPAPVCWTELPEKGASIFRQRARWHLGLVETLKIHRHMMFEPRYGATGLVALPYYFLFEMLAPVVKVFTLLYLGVVLGAGLVNARFVVLLLAGVMLLTAVFTSVITVVIEAWSLRQFGANRDALRYNCFRDWLWLLGAGLISDFSYGFFKTAAQLKGMYDFMRSKSEWNKFERKGFAGH